LGIAAVVALVLCCTWIVPLSYWIPLVNKIRELSWWSCLWVIAIVPLAACGATMLAERASQGILPRRSLTVLAGGTIAVVVLVALIDHSVSRAGAVLSVVFAGCLVALQFRGSVRAQAIVFLAPVLAAATFVPTAYVFPHSDASSSYYFAPRNVQLRQEATELSSALPADDIATYRAAVDPSVDDFKVLTHALANRGMRMIRGDIHPQLYSKFELLYFPNAMTQKLFGVRYTVRPDSESPGRLHWVTLDGARPRLYFRAVKPTVVPKPAASVLAESGEDAVRDFVSERVGVDGALSHLPETVSGYVGARILENSDNRIRAIISADSAGLLVLNEDPEGSWSAYVNHVKKDAFALNGFQSAFVIPQAGVYEIVVEGGR